MAPLNPRIVAVEPQPDYLLRLTFSNGEIRIFDVKPYLDKGVFKELREPSTFYSVKVSLGSIAWAGGQDLCPDTLFIDSKPA